MPYIDDIDTCDFTVYDKEIQLTRSNFTALIDRTGLNEEDNPLLIIELSSIKKDT